MLDILIKNATIIDGTGKPPFMGDIAVKDGLIAQIGIDLTDPATTVLDAAGKTVTPGFIDTHRHADLEVLKPTYGEIELRQGITTVIGGPCGLSLAPCPQKFVREHQSYLRPIIGIPPDNMVFPTFADYLDHLDNRPLATNFGCMVGTDSCRIAVKGFDQSPLTKPQRDAIAQHIRTALEAGAAGISSGIAYMPENSNTLEDFVDILRYAAAYHPIHAVHLRGEGDSQIDSVQEVLEIGRRTGVHSLVSHFKVVGKNNWGKSVQTSAGLIADARKAGRHAYFDIYPYEAGATLLLSLTIPQIFQEEGTKVVLERLHHRSWRDKITAALKAKGDGWDNLLINVGFENFVISAVKNPHNQKYVAKSILEVAQMQGKDPYEAAYDLIIDEEGQTTILHFASSIEDVKWAAQLDYGIFVSDALYSAGGTPHPRLYSAFPKSIRFFWREEQLLSLPEVIRKMTSLPATAYGLQGKGILQTGMDADLLVLDIENLQDKGVYLDPKQYPVGFAYVILGGQVVVKNDCYLGSKAGKLIRRKV